jgi:hypothetical protein
MFKRLLTACVVMTAIGQSSAHSKEDFSSANYLMKGCRNLLLPEINDYMPEQKICAGAVGAITDLQTCPSPMITVAREPPNCNCVIRMIPTAIAAYRLPTPFGTTLSMPPGMRGARFEEPQPTD